MWYLLDTIQSTDMVEGVDRWGESSVEAEDLSVHEGCQGEAIEQVCEVFPYARIAIFAQTLVVEPVDLKN